MLYSDFSVLADTDINIYKFMANPATITTNLLMIRAGNIAYVLDVSGKQNDAQFFNSLNDPSYSTSQKALYFMAN